MSVSVCCVHLCVKSLPVCVSKIKLNTRGHQRLTHTNTSTHRGTSPQRPPCAIFTSNYTFHLFIFILIHSKKTRGRIEEVTKSEEEEGERPFVSNFDAVKHL